MRKKISLYCKNIFIVYTLFFIMAGSLIVYCFHSNGRTLIGIGDAYVQAFPGLVKEIDYLKNIIHSVLVNRKLEVPLIDYTIGFGMDTVVNIFHDPIAVFGIFCPEKYYVLFYQIVPFVLLYFAGMFFIIFCRKIKIKKNYAVLMGCMVYLFSGYSLFSLTRYITFIYPLVYLPLCLTGIETMIQRKKVALLVLSTASCFIVSWYYAYMVTVGVVLYCMIRLFPMIRKKCFLLFFKVGFQLAGAYLLGVMASCAWMLPGIYGYFSSSRTGGNVNNTDSLWHYSIPYYRRFAAEFIIPGLDSFYEMFTAFLPVVLIALAALYAQKNKKKYKLWKSLCILLFVFAMFPIFGKIFNGGGYVSNRWCFYFAFTLGVIVAAVFSVVDELPKKQIYRLAVVAFVFAAFYFIFLCKDSSVGILVSIGILIGYAFIFCLYPVLSFEKRRCMLMGLTMCSVFLFIIIDFHTYFSDYSQKFLERNAEFDKAYLYKAGQIRDNSFYRVAAPWNETNFSAYYGYYGTSVYTNLVDKYTADFFGELSLNTERYSFQLTGIDGRSVLNDLFAVKYYVSNADSKPYGFVDSSRSDNTGKLFMAEKAVCPVHLYDTYMTKGNFMKLDALQRQGALHQAIIVDDKGEEIVAENEKDDFEEVSYVDHYISMPYQIMDVQNVDLDENLVKVNGADAKITFTFDAVENSETYLVIKGMELLSDDNIMTVYTGSEGNGNRFLILNKNFQYYVSDEVTVNIGYSEKGLGTCTLTFSGPGQFRYDSIEFASYPMEKFEQYRNQNLCMDSCRFEMGNNCFTCNLDIASKKFVQFSVPWSAGWKAYMDGESVEIYRTDTMFMSVLAEAGEHEISFVYCTPLLKIGMMLSVVANAILIGIYMGRNFRKI